jgi:hypothetical protein
VRNWLRGLLGAALLLLARPLLSEVAGRPATDTEVWLGRFLGARHLGEQIALACGLQVGGAVRLADRVHALSMVALAAVSPRSRRLAVAAVAAAVALDASGTAVPRT